jgi:hypothetical protein
MFVIKNEMSKKNHTMTEEINQYVYMIREREFFNLKKHIYKIGRTKLHPNTRLGGYPKGSEVVYFMQVKDCKNIERKIKNNFIEQFTQMRDIGVEYFQGDIDQMKRSFRNIINIFDGDSKENITQEHMSKNDAVEETFQLNGKSTNIFIEQKKTVYFGVGDIKKAVQECCEQGDKSDKIWKNDLMDKLNAKFDTSMTWREILPEMKRLGYKYMKSQRTTSLSGTVSCRGVIVGLKLRKLS